MLHIIILELPTLLTLYHKQILCLELSSGMIAKHTANHTAIVFQLSPKSHSCSNHIQTMVTYQDSNTTVL